MRGGILASVAALAILCWALYHAGPKRTHLPEKAQSVITPEDRARWLRIQYLSQRRAKLFASIQTYAKISKSLQARKDVLIKSGSPVPAHIEASENQIKLKVDKLVAEIHLVDADLAKISKTTNKVSTK